MHFIMLSHQISSVFGSLFSSWGKVISINKIRMRTSGIQITLVVPNNSPSFLASVEKDTMSSCFEVKEKNKVAWTWPLYYPRVDLREHVQVGLTILHGHSYNFPCNCLKFYEPLMLDNDEEELTVLSCEELVVEVCADMEEDTNI